ncbi:hypothetical protein BDW22DRAFT_967678 [Trametopsis cervina]|nr:hypothetical protein BDW22DRAFT_967678 [Trametopsis cervina]
MGTGKEECACACDGYTQTLAWMDGKGGWLSAEGAPSAPLRTGYDHLQLGHMMLLWRAVGGMSHPRTTDFSTALPLQGRYVFGRVSHKDPTRLCAFLILALDICSTCPCSRVRLLNVNIQPHHPSAHSAVEITVQYDRSRQASRPSGLIICRVRAYGSRVIQSSSRCLHNSNSNSWKARPVPD